MKKKITDKALILKKWGQEVSTGKPNPGLMGHQIILEGILEDFNLEDDFFRFLTVLFAENLNVIIAIITGSIMGRIFNSIACSPSRYCPH